MLTDRHLVAAGAVGGLAALTLLFVVLLSPGRDSDDSQPGGTPNSSPTPAATATPSAGASVTPAAGPPETCAGTGSGSELPSGSIGSPQSDTYSAQEVLSASYLGDAADEAIELALVPGRPNEAIIAGQSGFLYLVALDESFAPQRWGDVSDRLEAGGEEGLLSLAFSPNYVGDCRVYLYYTRGSPEPSVLSRFTATPANGLDEASEEVLITTEQPYSNHNGGHIVFGNDGYLYLGYGDGGSAGDPEDRAQDMTTLLGKMIRIDVSGPSGYTIPPDNPFIDGDGGARDEIYALGLRNPFRFTSDPVSGDIWIGDVGQGDWEEVSKLQKGGNYGWDCFEGPDEEDYTSDKCDGKTFVAPRAWYDHSEGSRSITGGVIYRGDNMPELYGWYVYADFYSGRIWALNPNTSSGEELLGQASINISSFTLAPDGELYIVSYSNGIYKPAR